VRILEGGRRELKGGVGSWTVTLAVVSLRVCAVSQALLGKENMILERLEQEKHGIPHPLAVSVISFCNLILVTTYFSGAYLFAENDTKRRTLQVYIIFLLSRASKSGEFLNQWRFSGTVEKKYTEETPLHWGVKG
jgi:hypothetical protein